VRYWVLVLCVLLVACGGSSAPPTPAANAPATQTRTAELAERATLTAPTATPVASPTPTPPTATTTTQRASTPAPATATSTARAPTATAVPPAQVAVEKVNSYRDRGGALWFVGEIVNTGSVQVAGLGVAVSLLDGSGQTIATGSATTIGLDILPPGAFTVWRALMNNAPQTWAEVRAQPQASPVSRTSLERAATGLTVEGLTLTPAAGPNDWLKVTGQVVNAGPEAASRAHVTMGLYDAAGQLIAVGDGSARLQQIPPGDSAPFSIDFLGQRDVPAHREVFVSGSRRP